MRYGYVALLTMILCVFDSPIAFGYESDVHHHLTKFLAQWAGFSEADVEQIAAADQELDAEPEFNPLPNPNFCPRLSQPPTVASVLATCPADSEFHRMLTAQRAYHFADGKRLQELRDSAFRGKNLKTLGHYLHVLQDTFAHSLMDYKDLPPMDRLAASLGLMPDEKIIGHLMYGHSVDKTYERPDLAEQMARYVYAEMIRFSGSANRWNEVEAAVVRFVNARDLDKKLRYLSAAFPPSSPVASSQPSGSSTTPQEPKHEGRTFAEWQADLRNSSPQVREKAAKALGHFGPKAVPILTQTLQDSDANVRWAAADALGDIGPEAKDAIPALVQALKDPEAFVRQRAGSALRQIAPAGHEEWQLAEWVAADERARQQEESPQQQAQAISAKAGPASRDQVPALLEILANSKDAKAREDAAIKLGKMRADARDAIPALTEASKRGNLAARKALRLIKFPSSPADSCRGELSQGLGGLIASQGYVRPCPEEGDEEKKAAADKLKAAFVRKHGVQETVACGALTTDPFAYESKVVLVHSIFERMVRRDQAILGEFQIYRRPPVGCDIVVSGVPRGVFPSEKVAVILAGRVLGNIGNGRQLPHLQYVGVHICEKSFFMDCDDFFGPESMR